jgi:hypothetical protein
MYKGVAFLFFVCFGCYILFTREPDFFDGETAPATIHWLHDSATNQTIPKAVFKVSANTFSVDARYVFRTLTENKRVEVIYNTAHPNKAAIYSWWGYWIKWGEWIIAILLLIALFQIAVSVTSNPTAEALIEQMEYKEVKKTKYD